MVTRNHQTKPCPDCKSDAKMDDSFCMKCGFDFIKYEKLLREKLKENEKECPECKLILDKSEKTCNNCGFPFPPDSISFNKQGAVINEKNITNNPIIENRNSTTNESTRVSINNMNNGVGQMKKSNNNSLYIILGIILFLIAGVVVYKFTFSRPSGEELEAAERAKTDSIAAVEAAYADSIAAAEAYSAERENAERENGINTNQSSSNLNQQDVINKIQKYYNGLQNGNIDANDFFSNNVIQYYTKTHLTPNEINELNNSGSQEFSNPEFIFNDDIVYNRSENEIIIYTINYHYKCFRESKQKFEECDVQAEIGINSNYEFVSLKEIKIDNLKFYEENGLSKTNYEEYNFNGLPFVKTPININPNPINGSQNVFFNKNYTLFDQTRITEPIFPVNKNGIIVYQIYYSSNEDPRPYYGEFTPTQLEKHLYYKFKNKENCMVFCNSKK